ncbi:hypothetical protein ACFL6I_23590, partial [candidate division KSB1 bacterium]
VGFVTIALLGYIRGTFFLNYLEPGRAFHLHSAGFIPYADIAISIVIVTSIFTIFAVLVSARYSPEDAEVSADENDDIEYTEDA